jgi:hypothetical protein
MNYDIYDKELMAVDRGLDVWWHLILGQVTRFWPHFPFLPWLIQRLIVYPNCSWLTVHLLTSMTLCLTMTELYLRDRARTLYRYWLVAPMDSVLPFSLTLGDDPFIYDVFDLGLRLRPSTYPSCHKQWPLVVRNMERPINKLP